MLSSSSSGKSHFLESQRHRHNAAINILRIYQDDSARVTNGLTNTGDFAAIFM